ncbi:DUF4114 domain-containing protein [Sphaerospermopsis kisseleviana CS-549]|uniref:DUF4114 domain-containing protein n=1 Tax=Sphaerospermopsis kisseleviana CS-549 TaxID=3021783 RepID=A0ABT4ZPU5_9CYAN|nr:DUF4114 domain-containing protein [Sphaerospermopsis kisseleviana]MDB9440783.1 DUF4114 domain-containing protein [Sphaerospermopsis kisseleviana CS-549]BAZ82592.1 hypothetical protein NIES73_38750 [Sphaerospermopsis kisseleviana NIES-73]
MKCNSTHLLLVDVGFPYVNPTYGKLLEAPIETPGVRSPQKPLGNNIFGFEDLPSGGDLDYNDVMIRISFSTV